MKDFELALAAQNAHFVNTAGRQDIACDLTTKTFEPLFRTKCTKQLVKLYKKLFRAQGGDAYAHYNCSTCKKFLRMYGTAVRVLPNGELESVFWPGADNDVTEGVGKVWREIFAALKDMVESAELGMPLIPLSRVLGTPTCGGWNHWSGTLCNYPDKSNVQRSRVYDTFTKEKEALTRNQSDYYRKVDGMDKMVVEAARDWLQLNPQTRSKHLRKMEYHIETANRLRAVAKGNRSNVVALLAARVALKDGGIYALASSVEGMLCDGIRSGDSSAALKGLFAHATRPDMYNMPSAPPKDQAVDLAEAKFAELNLESALAREFAPLPVIQQHALWAPVTEPEPAKEGLFAKHRPTPVAPVKMESAGYNAIAQSAFLADVLPTAKSMTIDNLTAFLHMGPIAYFCGPVNADAGPLFLWDDRSEGGTPNPYNWGFTSDFGHRHTRTTQPTVHAIATTCDHWNDRVGDFNAVMYVFEGEFNETLGNDTCLFPEVLRRDLYSVRSVIRKHSKESTLSGERRYAAASLQKGNTDAKLLISVETDAGLAKYSVVDI